METNPALDTREAEFTSTEWTDEKHSLYLKGMEASFVNQLYASSDFIGRHSKRDSSLDPKLPRQKPSALSGQFKVFQGGNWKKVSYGRNKGDDSRHLQANPWIQRFRGSKPQAVADPAMQEATESMNCCSNSRGQMFSVYSHQDMEGSENEMSDQNFVGEDIEGEKENSTCTRKRMKRMDLEDDGADSSS